MLIQSDTVPSVTTILRLLVSPADEQLLDLSVQLKIDLVLYYSLKTESS